MPTAAIGVSVLGAVVAAIGMAGTVAPTTLAILMLLPLSAFEATTPLPAAAIQLTRSRLAARRLLDLTPADTTLPTADSGPIPASRRHSRCLPGGCAPWTCRRPSRRRRRRPPVTVDLPPGARLAVTGPSGSGKTTLLMTLAGLLAPLRGEVTLDGAPSAPLDEDELRCAVSFFAEDAHMFATTVRDNLLVARGDCPDHELAVALRRVGLDAWLAGLPDGLDTVLSGRRAGAVGGPAQEAAAGAGAHLARADRAAR